MPEPLPTLFSLTEILGRRGSCMSPPMQSDTCITASGTETYAALRPTASDTRQATGVRNRQGQPHPGVPDVGSRLLLVDGVTTTQLSHTPSRGRRVDLKLRSRTRRAIKSFCKTSKLSVAPKQQAPRCCGSKAPTEDCHVVMQATFERGRGEKKQPALLTMKLNLFSNPTSLYAPSAARHLFGRMLTGETLHVRLIMGYRTANQGTWFMCDPRGVSTVMARIMLWSPPLDLKYEHLILAAGLGLSLLNPRVRDIAEKAKADFEIVVKEPLRRPFSHPDLSAEHMPGFTDSIALSKRTIFDSFKAPFFELRKRKPNVNGQRNAFRRCVMRVDAVIRPSVGTVGIKSQREINVMYAREFLLVEIEVTGIARKISVKYAPEVFFQPLSPNRRIEASI
ncbi:uncharacterized protein CLUP02_02984 [Colletotrichum lupini]|uniref:Uncharacterized protein n=1 Tax=Colletotrichum lupini TaxID=145971 RepID=A0A9Q8SIH4_9PEZI|nr:uncharacterized protein CLUP02_02984 [Colletotrichum lupini]UQC77516.1 hypothetical protein CLUP02_02984 [Colletotrichum lupini]